MVGGGSGYVWGLDGPGGDIFNMEVDVRIEIPIVAPSLNQWYAGAHWSKRKKVADQWHEEIWIACKQYQVEPLTEFPVIISTKTYFKTKRQRDVSNCFTTNKLAEDGLVKAGILPDDTPKFVCGHRVLLPVFGHDKDMTEIWIETTN